jgi:Icc-related predicted phosphoesterase
LIRLAAVGDLHYGSDTRGLIGPHLEHLESQADILLLAGDLTRCGDPGEAGLLAEELRPLNLPRLAVLGNHDHESGKPAQVRSVLESSGVQVLEGESATFQVDGVRVGVAGVKGFGGGFWGACGTDFGEPEMKAFVRHTRSIADRLERALNSLDAELRIALMHYSPIPDTLQGERLEIYPFLGSYLLAEAVDRAGANLVLHGHAHHGTEKGATPKGIPVRNVAHPVIRHAYNLYCFDSQRLLSGVSPA